MKKEKFDESVNRALYQASRNRTENHQRQPVEDSEGDDSEERREHRFGCQEVDAGTGQEPLCLSEGNAR